MKIYKELIQGTDEWFSVRKGKMTASHATAIGNCGKGLDTYCRQIVKEMIIPKPFYTNADIERGNELEPIARQTYEFEFGLTVEQVGFIEHNDFVGCSPDGLINEDGGLELKARNDDIHFGLLLGDLVDSSTIWQMNMCMLISGREWWDFGSYNPNFKQALFIKRFFKEEKKQTALLEGFKIGEQKIKELINIPAILKELRKESEFLKITEIK